jgi:hypothetical protein
MLDGIVFQCRHTQFVQQDKVQLATYLSLLPGKQTVPASHTPAALHILGQHLPRNSRLQNKKNASQKIRSFSVIASRMGFTSLPDRQQWLDCFVEFNIDQFGHHIASLE